MKAIVHSQLHLCYGFGCKAEPLGLEPHYAAYEIADLATGMIAKEISNVISRRGKSPEDYTLFAFGGNGGMVGCEVAHKVGIEENVSAQAYEWEA